MSPLQQHYLVITTLSTDRPGIVNTITRHVSSCGCNIEDSRLAMLGEEFTFYYAAFRRVERHHAN